MEIFKTKAGVLYCKSVNKLTSTSTGNRFKNKAEDAFYELSSPSSKRILRYMTPINMILGDVRLKRDLTPLACYN